MAGLDHEVHELVKQDHTARYGCINAPEALPYLWVQDRKYYADGRWIAYLSHIPDRFSKTCRYDLSHQDAKCEGCTSVGMGKVYDEDIRRRGT